MTQETVTITGPDGWESDPVTLDEMRRRLDKALGSNPMKQTDADRAVRDKTFRVTADELRQFVERYEHLEAEAKGRGYDTKILRKVIALRKRDADDIAEEEAVLEMYRSALGV